MSMHAQTNSTTQIGQDIAARLGRIAGLEARLVKAEARDNARRLVIGLGAVFVAALLALITLGALTASIVLVLIENGISPSASAGLVAGSTLVLSLAAGVWGGWLVRSCSLVPHRAFTAIKDVLRALREQHV